jgi:hypothetical protein
MKESNQLDITEVWMKIQENDKEVSRTVSEMYVHRMAEYGKYKKRLPTVCHNAKTQATDFKSFGVC